MNLLALVLSLVSIPSNTQAFRGYLSMCPFLFPDDPERVTWTFGALPQRWSSELNSREVAVPPPSGTGLDTPDIVYMGSVGSDTKLEGWGRGDKGMLMLGR
jgi:hypothetical protein